MVSRRDVSIIDDSVVELKRRKEALTNPRTMKRMARMRRQQQQQQQ